jgi:putative DNA primase/helicase
MEQSGSRPVIDRARTPDPKVLEGSEDKVYLHVPYKERREAQALGARWDRQEQSWFVSTAVDPAVFVRWARDVPLQSSPESRKYLAVPYGERDAAKAAGAQWDAVAKSWYAGPDGEAEQLKRWAPENVRQAQAPAMHPREEFAEAMRALGLVVEGEHPVMDGRKHRVPVVGGRKGAVDGFYVMFGDGHPAGRIINHKSGADEKWKSKGYTLTSEQKAVLRAEAAANIEQRAAALAEQHEQAAARVAAQLTALHPIDRPTPYLSAKGVQVHPGAFTDDMQKTTFIPAVDTDNKLWSMQYIREDGTKRFTKDSRKEGCFHAVGGLDALARAPAIVIGEGYATAATLAEVLGYATVAAFDAGNLTTVARALHARFPDKPIVIAGDDDHPQEARNSRNPGREKMEEAAKAVGAATVLPIFAPGEREARPHSLTDFNDLATRSALGPTGVERQVRAVVEAAIDKRAADVEHQLEQKLVQTNVHRQGQRLGANESLRQRRAARIGR